MTSSHELLHYFLKFTSFCTNFQTVTKRSQMHPNTMKHTRTWDYGPMGWIRCFRCEKLQRDFVARTFELIEPVQYVLHQVSCSYGTIPNAPKYFETHRNISLGSNGVDWICLLRKIPTWLYGTNFCINCTSSPHLHRVSCSYEMIPNAAKHYETHQNMSLGSNGMDQVRLLGKNYNVTSWHELLH